MVVINRNQSRFRHAATIFATNYLRLLLPEFKYHFIFSLLLTMCCQALSAQVPDPPQFTCIQVDAAGALDLSWQPTTDPGSNFSNYGIFTSLTQNGPYTSLSTVSGISSGNYTDITSPSLTTEIYYYLVSNSSAGTSVSSDTLKSIHLNAVPSTLPQGYAFLNWNSPFLPSANVPAGLNYEVWREYPLGVWTQVGTLPYGVTLWNYEISVCSAFMNFQIRLNVPGLCTFTSNIDGDTFQDLVPPAIPVVASVEVDHVSNDAVVSWMASTSGDTQGYILYKCNNNVLSIVDTIWGINNTQFVDILANTTIGPVSYLLAAFDTCYTGNPPSPNTSPTANVCNKSVFLNVVPYAICDDQITLSWSPYEGWEEGIESHIIYHSFVQAPLPPVGSIVFTPIDTISGGEFTYSHNEIELDGYNVYYVEAIASGSGFRAHSNIRSVLTPYPQPPGFVYMASASVLDQKHVEVKVSIDPTTLSHNYALQRRDVNGGNWDDLVTLSAVGQSELIFDDLDVNTDALSETYRVITTNQCQDVIDTTNFGTTILLSGLANTDRSVNVLVWSVYGDWTSGVEKYRVHRIIGNTGVDEVITEIGLAGGYFEDDVSQLPFTEGKFCYYIEAVERPFNVTGNINSAISNKVCLAQVPIIWVPNAFVVDGFNSTFKPVISFADFNNYQMIIYSRWGDVIYETDDINAPWDGKMDGTFVQEGAYPYYISVKDGQGRLYEKVGYVIMLNQREQ